MTMAEPAINEADFLRLFEEIGPSRMHQQTGVSLQRIYRRRRAIEAKIGRALIPPEDNGSGRKETRTRHAHRIELSAGNGVVLVASDAHYWPGEATPGHRAFVHFVKEQKPVAVIMNGDVFDGASVSRHPPIGWASQPTVQQEIEACQERLGEIEAACPRGTRRLWPLGNHDARFETRIATVAPEYAKVAGVSLQDHFPLWEPCWSVFINDDVVVKHRFKGGMHAPQNNTLWGGRTMVTGHLHSAKVQPISDYNGTRYGVDTGCIADPYGEQFLDYTEDSPRSWRSAFCVLTFRDGKLLQPELAMVWDQNSVQFRGNVIQV